MRVAAIDQGTNTTRLLVADVADGRVDKDGRLVLAGDAQLPDRLARGQVIIYVGKLQR